VEAAPEGPFTREQANGFMKACEGSKLATCLRFLLNTGPRPEEIVALRWADLKLEGTRGVCQVRKVILRIPGGGRRFEEPKSKSSVRIVGFPSWLSTELKEHRKRMLEEKMRAGRYYKDHDLVFPSLIGTPQVRSTVVAEFKATLKRAGLSQRMRLYDLRHSFVTIGLAAGVDPKTVSEEGGHATVAFTLDHYGHVLQTMRDGSVDKREAWL
jgi:integrase